MFGGNMAHSCGWPPNDTNGALHKGDYQEFPSEAIYQNSKLKVVRDSV